MARVLLPVLVGAAPCVAVGVIFASVEGALVGAILGAVEALFVAIVAIAVHAGWRPVGLRCSVGDGPLRHACLLCDGDRARRRNAGFSDDLVYLDHRVAAVIGVPLMVMAPVGGWMVVARREAR
ncbi:MAG TPA: hypothetical protein VFZ70_00115 [Euzebyales bacterium]